jgi:hypothetical protein
MKRARRLPALARGAFALAVRALLLTLRPAWPALPRSLDTPVTTSTVKSVAVALAWLLLVGATFLALVHSVRAGRRDEAGRGSRPIETQRLGSPRPWSARPAASVPPSASP